MIIRGHMIQESVHPVGQGMIGDICENHDIIATHGFRQYGLSLSGAEAGNLNRDLVAFLDIVAECRIFLGNIMVFLAKGNQPAINGCSEFLCGRHDDESERGYRNFAFQLFV